MTPTRMDRQADLRQVTDITEKIRMKMGAIQSLQTKNQTPML